MAQGADTAAAADPDTARARPPALGGALSRPAFSWALYEWARNPYYMLVVVFVFAPYFAEHVIGAGLLASGAATTQADANALGQARIAEVIKWAGVIAACSAPFLGAALDRGGRRKPLVALCLFVVAACSFSLWWVEPGGTGIPAGTAMAVLVAGFVAYTYSEVIHNAMLGDAARPDAVSATSGLGLGLGQLATAVLLIAVAGVAAPALLAPAGEVRPGLFGIDTTSFEHFRMVGPICAVWLAAFIAPFFLWAPDGGRPNADWRTAVISGATGVLATFRRARVHANAMKFLGARVLYADGMAALLAIGPTYVSLFLGWNFLELVAYAIYSSVFGFVGGLLGGWLDRRFGARRALIVEITVLIFTLAALLSVTQDSLGYGLIPIEGRIWEGPVFNSLADIAYLAVGAVLAAFATASISSSRSLMVGLAPPEMRGEFFGLFAIAGTITVWIGPLLIETLTEATRNQRIGMASIGVLFVAGLIGLFFVRDAEKRA